MAARRYGRRLRRGAAGTAVAAAAMAALGASQAPGLVPVAHAATQTQQHEAAPVPPGPQIDGGSPYFTQMPPLNTPAPPLAPVPGGPDGGTVSVPGGASLPAMVLAAYQRAQASLAASEPGCHLPWELLAAIGQVESGQARGGAVDANGTTFKPILGPVLNGNGFADIPDTDNGRYDGDPVHDRAVGPMQFIPSTWAHWGADGNGDGVADPNNVFDAALAAGRYLCADGRDLSQPAEMDRAILGYNHSQAYLNLVRAWYEHFRRGGAASVPDAPGAPGKGVTPHPDPSPSTSSSPSPSPSPTHVGGTVGTTSPSPSTSPTGGQPTTTPPTTSPTGGGTTSPPVGDPTTSPTDPTDPPTTPGCTDSPSPTPTGSGTVSPSPTASGDDTASPTPDPCDTDTTSPSPAPSDTAGTATGAGVTSAP